MRRILIGADSRESASKAVDYLLAWEQAGANTVVKLVYFESLDDLRSFATTPYLAEARLQERANRAIGEVEARLDAHGVIVSHQVIVGAVAEAMHGIAQEFRADEIVIRSRGRGLLRQLGDGSTALDIVARAGLPVTLVRDGTMKTSTPRAADVPSRRVLMVLESNARSQPVVDYATALHARSPTVSFFRATVPLGAASQAAASPPGVEAAHQSECQSTAEGGASIPPWVDVGMLGARTAVAVVDCAVQHGCDRIIMATQGLGMLQSVVRRPLSYAVARASPVPVTLIKPSAPPETADA